jgi:endonuclease/exonuclease/phosphatase (EEP) superfamily protein YafD
LRFTFPQGRGPFPFVAIDHVLVRDAPWQASGTETVVMDGTDHRALVVTYSAK